MNDDEFAVIWNNQFYQGNKSFSHNYYMAKGLTLESAKWVKEYLTNGVNVEILTAKQFIDREVRSLKFQLS